MDMKSEPMFESTVMNTVYCELKSYCQITHHTITVRVLVFTSS